MFCISSVLSRRWTLLPRLAKKILTPVFPDKKMHKPKTVFHIYGLKHFKMVSWQHELCTPLKDKMVGKLPEVIPCMKTTVS